MKLLFFTLCMVLLINGSVFAAAGRSVKGNITDGTGNPIDNAQVTIVCLGHELNTSTDSSGFYIGQFEKLSHCLKGSAVKVTAEKDEGSITDSKKMGDTFVEINLAFPVASVPEFSTATLLTACVVSGMLIVAYKKKRLHYS